MAEYTRESLQNIGRIELRRIAMQVLGMTVRQVSEMKSADIIDAILAKQGEAPAAEDKKAPKRPKREELNAETPHQEAPAVPAGVSVEKRIDALGKALDELSTTISDMRKALYVTFGLVGDIWLATCGDGKDSLDERVQTLEADYEGK